MGGDSGIGKRRKGTTEKRERDRMGQDKMEGDRKHYMAGSSLQRKYGIE